MSNETRSTTNSIAKREPVARSGGPMATMVDKVEAQKHNDIGRRLWFMAYHGELDEAIRRAANSAARYIASQYFGHKTLDPTVVNEIERHVRRELGL